MATDTDIREALRHVIDPELGVNIVDLGLVYRIEVEGARARIAMTMTSPACPLVDLPEGSGRIGDPSACPGVWRTSTSSSSGSPPWDPDMMSDEARRQLDEGER